MKAYDVSRMKHRCQFGVYGNGEMNLIQVRPFRSLFRNSHYGSVSIARPLISKLL